MRNLIFFLFSTLALPAASIVIFSNPPTTGAVNVTNISNSFTTLGHSVTTFSSLTDWSTNLNSANLAVIPDLDADLYAALTLSQRSEIANFVSGGRNLVVTGGDGGSGSTNAFLNGIFGFSVQALGSPLSSSLNTTNAAGTPFAGGPSSAPVANQIFPHTTASLPIGVLTLYENGSNTTVWSQNVGSGKVIYLAYDWFSGANTNWDNILGRTVTYGATDIPSAPGVPEPASLALTSAALAVLAALGHRARR